MDYSKTCAGAAAAGASGTLASGHSLGTYVAWAIALVAVSGAAFALGRFLPRKQS